MWKWWRRRRPALAPGASGPGEPGYEGRATVGDEGAAAVGQSWRDVDGVGAPEADDAERD
jgi:hypothetical protein